VIEIISLFDFWAFVDVIIIATIIYQALTLIRGTRAAQMLGGTMIVVALFLLSSVFPLTTLNWVLSKFYSSFIVFLIIIFQDDIRHVLSRMWKGPVIAGAENVSSMQIIDEIVRAASALAQARIGALIVLERSILLSRYINVGIQIDSKITKELLLAIFHPTSPVHDGAVIIQRGRITAAGCFLPLTRQEGLDPNMGTRHRAAIGITQETDAVTVLVSEEQGTVSLASDGHILRRLDAKQLRRDLRKLMSEDDGDDGDDIKQVSERGGGWYLRFLKLIREKNNRRSEKRL
jgi:diadenylate cyclase